MRKKIQIDALPCSSGSFQDWFDLWMASAVLLIGIIGLVSLSGLEGGAWIMWLTIPFIITANIAGIVFNVIFARSLKSVSKRMYEIMLVIALLPIPSWIINIYNLYNFQNVFLSGSIGLGFIISSIFSIISIILWIVFIVMVCRNYSGQLGKLGRNLWLVLVISVGIFFIAVLLSGGLSDFSSNQGITIYLVAAVSVIYLIYTKILKVQYDLLDMGYYENLTDDEMASYINDSEEITEVVGN